MPHPRSQTMRNPNGLANYAGSLGAEAEEEARRQGRTFQGLPPQDLVNAFYDIFGSYPRKNVLPYFYQFNLRSTNSEAIAANGTSRPNIKVSADASFVCNYITGSSTGEYLIFFRTDSSDRQLMDDAVNSSTIVGTAERPMILPKPLLLAPNTTISFELTDISGQENEVYLTLCGFKVYRQQYAMAG